MRRRNALIVTIDCGRQDLIYGPRVRTPHLDALSQEGIVFQEAFSQINNTMPSHYSLFTGLYCAEHGIYTNFEYKPLPRESLVHRLREAGWKTAAFVSVGFLAATLGKEFEYHDEIPFETSFRAEDAPPPGVRRGPDTVDAAIRWLVEQRKEPFFLWVHLFDTHMIYWAPKSFREEYFPPDLKIDGEKVLHQLKKLGFKYRSASKAAFSEVYDLRYYPALHRAATASSDREIGRLLSTLKQLNLYDDTLVVVTSDHGENLGEHRVYCNHGLLYDETTKVPLIVKWFDGEFAGTKVRSLVQHIDITPTILEALGLYPTGQGRSFFPLLQGRVQEINEYVIGEAFQQMQRTIRSLQWQLIHTPKWAEETIYGQNGLWELRKRFPDETSIPCNLIDHLEVVEELLEILDRIVPFPEEIPIHKLATVKLYRYWHPLTNRYLYTIIPELERLEGWVPQGYVCKLFPYLFSQIERVKFRKLVRYYSRAKGRHLFTIHGKEAPSGYVCEGILGKVALAELPGTVPLYYYYNPRTGAHLYTLDFGKEGLDEESREWEAKGVVGYVVPPEPGEECKREIEEQLRALGYVD